MQDKTQKFSHFYLTELLHHVKSMSEHRYDPVEYAIIRKITHFIVASDVPLNRFTQLRSVVQLKPLTDFIVQRLERMKEPDFRMSLVMSSLESDSEKISQIFHQILENEPGRRQLETALAALGLDLDLDSLSQLSTAAPRGRTSASTVTSTTADTERAEAFDRVGDVVGFLNRRKRGETRESGSREPETVQTVEQPAVVKVPEGVDFGLFTRDLKNVLLEAERSLLELAKNPGSSHLLTEAADALGEVRKITRVYGFEELSQVWARSEKTLNDLADNLDEKNLQITHDGVDRLRSMVGVLDRFRFADYGSEGAKLIRSLEDVLAHVESGLTARVRPVRVGESETGKHLELPESEPVEREFIPDLRSIAAEDLAIFKDEMYSYFDSVDSALLDLQKDLGNLSAVKIIHLSTKSLTTAARMVKLEVVADLCRRASTACARVVKSGRPVTDTFPGQILRLRSTVRLLAEGQPVFESDLENLRAYFEAGMLTAEPEIVVSELPSVVKEESRVTPASSEWVDAVQQVLTSLKGIESSLMSSPNFQPSVVASRTADETAIEEKPAPPTLAEVVRERPRKPVRAPLAEKKKAAASSELLSLMANDNLAADLSEIKADSFMERINHDPEDIPEVRARSRKKGQESIPEPMETPAPLPEIVEEPQPSEGAVLIHESHFNEVDAEILEIFIQESDTYMKVFDRSLQRLKDNLKDDNAIKDLERTSHSLKSSARMLGFERISGMAGAIELISERYFEKEIAFSPEILELFNGLVEALRSLFRRRKHDIQSVVRRLADLEEQLGAPGIFTRNIPGASDMPSTDTDRTGRAEIPATEPKGVGEKQRPSGVKAKTVTAAADYFAGTGVDQEIVDIFKEESQTYLSLVAASLAVLAKDAQATAAMKDMEKAAHSLRSSAKMLGFQKISDVVRPVEGIAERLYRSSLSVSPEVMLALREAGDVLDLLVSGKDTDVASVVEKLERLEREPAISASPTAESDRESVKTREGTSSGVPRIRKAEKKDRDIPDFQIKGDPIFKRLFQGEEDVLKEMAHVSDQQS